MTALEAIEGRLFEHARRRQAAEELEVDPGQPLRPAQSGELLAHENLPGRDGRVAVPG